jgi:hypothetical protein
LIVLRSAAAGQATFSTEVEGVAEIKSELLFPREAIGRRVKELAEQISRDYAGRELLLVGVLNGAFIFMADLIRGISIPCRVDFVRLSSYGCGSQSSGEVRITKDLETPITGRDVLIVEDIVDTGLCLMSSGRDSRRRFGSALSSTRRSGGGFPSRQSMWVTPFPIGSLSDMDLIIMKISVFFPTSAC